MSAILSADDLNDFISPSVACIKPVETLPLSEASKDPENPYEVTTEDAAAAANAPPAQISLTDCLACSGCVTSAEAVLVSLQSYQEVLATLEAYPELPLSGDLGERDGKIFVASVSPQARASIAATFGVSERKAGHMIHQLLSGDQGLRSGGMHKSGFAWVLDTNALREVALVAAVQEAEEALTSGDGAGDFTQRGQAAKKPVLTSACPGWICYAEKTHPHVLPHISKLKSPQALAGTLVKTVLAKHYGISPDKIWHMAVMPCFDKKLEASREELTEAHWDDDTATNGATTTTGIKGIRDVDLVITSRELLSLAEARGISLPDLSHRSPPRVPFPDPTLNSFLFRSRPSPPPTDAGTSGGYLWHILRSISSRHPGSRIETHRGRNADVLEYTVLPSADSPDAKPLFRAARFYGFRNIQNLVRRLRPARASRIPGAASRRPGAAGAGAGAHDAYDYVEVMACPGGCTNGGGQVRPEEAGKEAGREWLRRVDEAYYSASDSEEEAVEEPVADSEDTVDGISRTRVWEVVGHWSRVTGLSEEALLRTTYRKVESDVGKKASDVERVAGLASSIGGGW